MVFPAEARVARRSVCQRKKRDVVEQHGASARAAWRFALWRSRGHAGEAQRFREGEDKRRRRGLGGWTAADGPGAVAALRGSPETRRRFAHPGKRTDKGGDELTRGPRTHGAATVSVWPGGAGAGCGARCCGLGASLRRKGKQRAAGNKERGLVFDSRAGNAAAGRNVGEERGATGDDRTGRSNGTHRGLGHCAIFGIGCAGPSARRCERVESETDCLVRIEQGGRSFRTEAAISASGGARGGGPIVRLFGVARLHVESQEVALRNSIYRERPLREPADSRAEVGSRAAGVSVHERR